MPFTAEELAEMASADREIEKDFRLTIEDVNLADALDKVARVENGQKKRPYKRDLEKERLQQRERYRTDPAYRAKKQACSRARYQKLKAMRQRVDESHR